MHQTENEALSPSNTVQVMYATCSYVIICAILEDIQLCVIANRYMCSVLSRIRLIILFDTTFLSTCSIANQIASLIKSYTIQELNFCLIYTKYYIYIQRLFHGKKLDLYTSLTQLKFALEIVKAQTLKFVLIIQIYLL